MLTVTASAYYAVCRLRAFVCFSTSARQLTITRLAGQEEGDLCHCFVQACQQATSYRCDMLLQSAQLGCFYGRQKLLKNLSQDRVSGNLASMSIKPYNTDIGY